MNPTDFELYRLDFVKGSRDRNQRSIYQLYQKIENLDEHDLKFVLLTFFDSSEASDDFLNLFGFYRSLLLRKASISRMLVEQMEDHHIDMVNGLSQFDDEESLRLYVLVLGNINLAMRKGHFGNENTEFHLKVSFLFKLRSFNHGKADDRHLLQFFTESVKLLRNLNMAHDVPGALFHIQHVLSARPSMVSCFSVLCDMEDDKPRTAFIENHPDDLVPLLGLLIIHASLALLSSDVSFEEFRRSTSKDFFFKPNADIYPQFFKIFATDTDAMYEALNLMMTRQWIGPLSPVRFYSVMVHGATDGRSFYENHIHRNPDGMQFVFSILKSLNQNVFGVDNDMRSPESYALHSSLRNHFLDLLGEDRLEFNPAPYLKQLDLYLKKQ